MTCPRCHQPLLSCNCPEAPTLIESFLNSPAGQALPNSTHNTLVRRAAHLIDLRMIGAFPAHR